MDPKSIRKQLRKILKEYEESVQIQMSSEKILNFLINDILDFAQIRQNKFRKDTQTFNITDAVNEIKMV